MLGGLVAGVAVGVPVGNLLGAAAGALAGWSVGALVLSTWVLLVVWPMDSVHTRTHARREDPGRRFARILSTVGSLASLVAVGLVLGESHASARTETWVLAGIAVISVLASWVLIQVDYMLRYAYMYYAAEASVIDFNEEDDPQYSDFAYFSVGLGMTYQVADTNVRSKEVRKVVIAQTMLAYLFGAVIVATVINLVTGLGAP